MPHRRPLLPAPVARRTPQAATPASARLLLTALLVAFSVLAPGLALSSPAAASPTPAPPAAPAPQVQRTTAPLVVEIGELSPSVPRPDEQVQLSGTITNVSDETWTNVNVHAFHSATPIRDAATLAAAATIPEADYVGERVVEPGTFQTIPSLAPEESATFTAVLPAGVLAGGDGVYWAGLHALAESESTLRGIHGRARTFLPVLSGKRQKLDAALVLPLRAPVRYTPAGRVASPARWARLLGPGGRLRNLLESGAAAGERPVTWLLDPAVPHAAMKLAAGNPRASLEPLPGAEEDAEDGEDGADGADGEDGEDGGSEQPLPAPTEPTAVPETPADEGDAEVDADQAAAAEAATGWLELFRAEMAAHPVLALPYGDVDASAMQRHDPDLLRMARAHSVSLLTALGVEATPVLASPDGFLSPDVVAASDLGTVMLLSDRAVRDPAGGTPSTGRVLGRTFATTSSGVAAGGPGPEPAAGPVAVRQRVVSEAALRLLAGDGSPLVIAPPPNWDPATGSAVLYTQFDEGLLRLRPLASLVGADVLTEPDQGGDGVAGSGELPPEALVYGEPQVEAELPAVSVRAATERLAAARLLDGVLTRPSGLVGQLVEAVLPSTSYFGRRSTGESAAWRKRNVRGTRWLEERLGSIRVETPLRATLSSDRGTLGVTLVNDLDVSVTVRIESSSQGGVRIEDQEPLTLRPRSRRLLRMTATATRQGTDELTLRVTDVEGNPLGASATYPVRTSQVSGTVWVIMGVGAALFFGMIGVRFVRGNRRTRLEQAEAEARAAEDDDEPHDEPDEPGDGTDQPDPETEAATP